MSELLYQSTIARGADPLESEEMSNKLRNMCFVCACLVVTLHVGRYAVGGSAAWWLTALLRNTISRMAMPFFFMVSGFILASRYGERNWWMTAVKERLRTLVLPAILFAMAYWAARTALPVFVNFMTGHNLLANVTFGFDVVHVFGLSLFRYPELGPLWFLRCLMLLVMLSPVLFFFLKRRCLGGALIARARFSSATALDLSAGGMLVKRASAARFAPVGG